MMEIKNGFICYPIEGITLYLSSDPDYPGTGFCDKVEIDSDAPEENIAELEEELKSQLDPDVLDGNHVGWQDDVASRVSQGTGVRLDRIHIEL